MSCYWKATRKEEEETPKLAGLGTALEPYGCSELGLMGE